MNDGVYALRFSADGYEGDGTFALQRNRGHGGNGLFRVEGHLVEKQNRLTAIVNVLMQPAAVHNARLPEHYSLNMTGTSSGDAFSLIGIGPLGVIVDLDARWSSPLADEHP